MHVTANSPPHHQFVCRWHFSVFLFFFLGRAVSSLHHPSALFVWLITWRGLLWCLDHFPPQPIVVLFMCVCVCFFFLFSFLSLFSFLFSLSLFSFLFFSLSLLSLSLFFFSLSLSLFSRSRLDGEKRWHARHSSLVKRRGREGARATKSRNRTGASDSESCRQKWSSSWPRSSRSARS